jgi:hypothetical protein
LALISPVAHQPANDSSGHSRDYGQLQRHKSERDTKRNVQEHSDSSSHDRHRESSHRDSDSSNGYNSQRRPM